VLGDEPLPAVLDGPVGSLHEQDLLALVVDLSFPSVRRVALEAVDAGGQFRFDEASRQIPSSVRRRGHEQRGHGPRFVRGQ